MHVTALILFFLHLKIKLSETLNPNCDGADDDTIDDYYWRDYTGVIPNDALPGGLNAHGNTTYIGQAFHENHLFPAKIDPEESPYATYEWGFTEYRTNKKLKILCTKTPEAFEWAHAGNENINSIKGKHFVVGGCEPTVALLIGRTLVDGELSIGKVVFGGRQFGLNTSKNGKAIQHAVFQLLVYNPAIAQNKMCCNECQTYKTTTLNLYN